MEKRLVENSKLRLIVFKSAMELGQKVDEELCRSYHLDKNSTFMIPINELFFEDGHLKVEIKETVREKDVFFLTDIHNNSLTYNMCGYTNHTSPNDLLMQLKDGIGACNRHADNINIIMPALYAGRQHRRNTRENLMCGQVLRELDQNRGIRSFCTFDAHDPSVEHAIEHMEFDNVFPTEIILNHIIDDLPVEQLRNIVFIAPDNGATGRRNVYLNSFNSPYVHRETGSFVKQRDYNNLVDGKYPIISHDYCGNDNIEGYTAIVSDDMISSGGSMFDVIDELSKKGVENIYLVVSYSLFVRGVDKFQKYYEDGKLSGVYTTNLVHIKEEYKNNEWLHICDCSPLVADIIYKIHHGQSISSILRDKSGPVKRLEKKFKSSNIEL